MNREDYAFWCVSEKDLFDHQSYKRAYGIQHAEDGQSCWYPGNWENDYYQYNNGISKAHFRFKRGEVDMLLDIDKGELKFCVVGKMDKGEAVLYNLPKQEIGWVPHLIANSNNIEFRIAMISVDLYGKPIDNMF